MDSFDGQVFTVTDLNLLYLHQLEDRGFEPATDHGSLCGENLSVLTEGGKLVLIFPRNVG